MINLVALGTLNPRELLTNRVKTNSLILVQKIDEKKWRGKQPFDIFLSSSAVCVYSTIDLVETRGFKQTGKFPMRVYSTSIFETTVNNLIIKRRRRIYDDNDKINDISKQGT